MKYFINKTRLVVSVVVWSLVIIVAMVAPQALAHDAATQRIKQLEQSLQAIQVELEKIKSETSQAVQKVNSVEQTTNQTAQEVSNIKETNQAFKERLEPLESRRRGKSRMLFFRGGFTHAMQNRNGSSIRSEVTPIGPQDTADKDGFYVGAGLDWNLTNDVWGAMPRTSIFAELMFEYKEFSNKVQGNGALGTAPSALAAPGGVPRNVTVSQFTLSASPKIKFMEGSRFRPWIIPAGLAIHVYSPTSESVTYLTPGVMFAAGADYRIWKDFFVGIDARYNLTAGKSDGVRVDGMTAGGYLGIGF